MTAAGTGASWADVGLALIAFAREQPILFAIMILFTFAMAVLFMRFVFRPFTFDPLKRLAQDYQKRLPEEVSAKLRMGHDKEGSE